MKFGSTNTETKPPQKQEVDIQKALGLVEAAIETLVDIDGDLIDDSNCQTLRILEKAKEALNG